MTVPEKSDHEILFEKLKEFISLYLANRHEEANLAFEKIYADLEPNLRRFANYLLECNRAAEDSVQDAFMNIIRNLRSSKFQSWRKFRSYCFQSVYNKCIAELRKRAVRRALGIDTCDEVLESSREVNPQAKCELAELIGQVRRLVNQLTGVEKALLFLKINEDPKVPEATEVLRISTNALNVRWHRLIPKLRNIIELDSSLSLLKEGDL